MLMKKIAMILLLIGSFISATVADDNKTTTSSEYVWVSGKLQAIYNSAYNVQNPQANVQYSLQISKIKSLRLDMSKLATLKWQVLVGKDVEIKVSKANELAVASDRKIAYMVLDIRYNPSVQKSSKLEKALAQPDAKKPWLNILCKFADIATEPHPSDFYQTMFGNTYPYLEHYWKDTTYGHIDISGTQTIDEWVTLPHDRSYYVDDFFMGINMIKEDCINASGVANTLDTYYGTNLFFNADLDGPAYGGGGTTWLPTWAGNKLGTIAHEMGHAYGLPHSSGRYGSNYDSPWDVMSNAHRGGNFGSYDDIPQHTIAFHKQKLGAININAQWTNTAFDTSSGYTLHLSRLEEFTVIGEYLVVNISSADGSKHYSVEARDKIGYDSPLPAKAVIIHEIEDNRRAYIIDPDNNGDLSDAGTQWQVGETFTDSVNNISIEILSTTETGYNIRVTAPRIKPVEVIDITATDNLWEKVRVSWSSSTGAEYYKVSRYDSWDVDSTHQTFMTANNDTYYDDVPDDAYYHYYRVQACNSAGCSTPSTYLYGSGYRVKVDNVVASNDQINNIHISWETLVGATYYKVLRYDDYQATTNRQEFITNNAYYDDIQSTGSNYYYYKVQACNSNGCSLVSIDATYGSRFFTLSASDGTFIDKVEVSFTPDSSISSYALYRVGEDYWDEEYITEGTQSPLVDRSAKIGIKYEYFMLVYYANGDSFWIANSDEGYLAPDSDSDSDGIKDSVDNCPYSSNPIQEDLDNDNLGNVCDSDMDGDGVENNVDTDDDGDGVLDINDAFPLDSTESLDTDNDGIGNNADTDDGNGVLDVNDDFPLDIDGALDVDDEFPLDDTQHTTLTNIEKFVTRFYEKILDRSADTAGLTDWSSQLASGTKTGADIAKGFIFSAEFTAREFSDEQYVRVLYAAFFDREADAGGLTGWLSILTGASNNVQARVEVLDGFLNSTEFKNLADSYGIKATETLTPVEQFVTRFYEQCLQRSPDEAGLNDWSTQLSNGSKAGADIARGFIFSIEFIERDSNNAEYLNVLYRAFFSREADLGGFDAWMAQLNAGTSREEVLQGFLGAPEFSNLAGEYGIRVD